jgi:uncharacterized protein (DUF1697 family)
MRYAAFLRGINVGKRQAKKAELAAPFEQLGFAAVTTFRASGNVLFDAGSKKPSRKAIEDALADALGFEAAAFLRSATELNAIAARSPFTEKELATSNGKLQVVFLERKPAKGVAKKIRECATHDDLLALDGSELFWLPNLGVGRSELNWKAIEEALGAQTTTVRTMGTVEQIAAKL